MKHFRSNVGKKEDTLANTMAKLTETNDLIYIYLNDDHMHS